jgi:hypothetical protein
MRCLEMGSEGNPSPVLLRGDDLVIEERGVESGNADELSGEVIELHCTFDLATMRRLICE